MHLNFSSFLFSWCIFCKKKLWVKPSSKSLQDKLWRLLMVGFFGLLWSEVSRGWWIYWVSCRLSVSQLFAYRKLFFLCQFESDFDETWHEWYDRNGLRSIFLVIRLINFKLFLLSHFFSDFDKAWYERCEGKGIQSHGADFEYW